MTPGVKGKYVAQEEEELGNEESSQYRALVARANYLAQDRPDIQYSVKELCREMSSPKVRSWNALKRLARYLLGHPRFVLEYKRQGRQGHLETWVDTDYAGCIRTRKSTSGGVIKLGRHVVKSWSSTQKVISLSSGEAEYYGMVTGYSNGKWGESHISGQGKEREHNIHRAF